jgi:hypothetical protein
MSPVALGLDILLVLLLLAALGVGLRLNRRLTALREGHAGFAKAVAELNAAAARAEAGLKELRAAADETHDDLLTRIETARGLIGKLDTAAANAERAVEKAAAAPPPRPAAARPLRFADPAARSQMEWPQMERVPAERPQAERPRTPPVGAPSPFDLPLDTPVDIREEQLTFPSRRRLAADDDLFEDKPRRSGER